MLFLGCYVTEPDLILVCDDGLLKHVVLLAVCLELLVLLAVCLEPLVLLAVCLGLDPFWLFA